MLTIRKAQMQALAAVPLGVFEDELVAHCRGHASRLFVLRGEDCIRGAVRTGMARARQAGFTLKGPVRFWVELMFRFGHDFDTDPQLAWLAPPLADRGAPELARARALYLAMSDYLAEVEGAAKADALDALRRVLATDWATLAAEGPGYEPSVLAAMDRLYPQKVARVGEAALRRIVTAADTAAARHRVRDAGGRALIAGLMFGFGHGVLGDPLYPWVASTLAGGDGSQRWPRLAAKTRTYAQAMIDHLGA